MSNIVQLKDSNGNNVYPVASTEFVAGNLNVITYSEINENISISAYELLDIVYPIGSVYWSSTSTNPSILFGGVWEQVTDRFLVAAGDNYANKSTGGSATHVHGKPNAQNGTLEAMIGSGYGDPASLAFKHSNINSCVVSNTKVNGSSYSSPSTANSHNTAIIGVTAESSSMPPYVVKYCWERIE